MSPDNSLSPSIYLYLLISLDLSRSLSPYFTISWCHRDLTLTILVTLGISPSRYLWFFYLSRQGWQVLDGLGKNRLKPPVKTVRKKQVLDSENDQNWSKL